MHFLRSVLTQWIFFLLLLKGGALLAQSTAKLYGVVTDQNGDPIENVVVIDLFSQKNVTTNARGRYEMQVIHHEEIPILFRYISCPDTLIYISLAPGEEKEFNITLQIVGKKLGPVDVTASHDDGYVRVNPKLRFNIPSPMGGAESVIKTFAGVSSVNELSSQYNVRGGNYDENLIYVNDIQIYRPFLIRSGNQEGLSFVNLDLTKNVKFSAGGFAAQYGDKMSSVMDVEYKTPTEFAGSFSMGLLGATAHVEGVVKDKTKTEDRFTYLIGVRYKSNAYLFRFMEIKGEYKPQFFDTQMLLDWKLNPKFNISLLTNFSANTYLYQPKNRKTNFGSLEHPRTFMVYYEGQELDLFMNYLGGLTLTYKPTQEDQLKFIISSYYSKEKEQFDILSEYWLKDAVIDLAEGSTLFTESTKRGVGAFRDHARNRLDAFFTSFLLKGDHKKQDHLISWGVQYQNEWIDDHIREWNIVDSSGYILPHITLPPGEPVPLEHPARWLTFGENRFLFSVNKLNTHRVTGFLQDQWRLTGDSSQFILHGGVRFHYWNFNRELTVSPRVGLLYKPKWSKDCSFWLKTGVYYQSPTYREFRRPDGTLNPDIQSQFSYQALLSADYEFALWGRPFKLTSELYYKYMDRLISYEMDNVRIVYSGENDSKGYVYGTDLKLSGEFIKGMESWIAISLMKTAQDFWNDFYTDSLGNCFEIGYVPRPSDQRFALNLFFQDHIPNYPQWRVHLNFIFSSGLPFVAPNAPNWMRTFRTPWYRRVDLGLSYLFLQPNRDRHQDRWKSLRHIDNAALYVEVFNLLDIANVSSYSWVPDIDGALNAIPNSLTPILVNVKLAFEF